MQDPTTMIMTLVGSLGFPIAITIYVLTRMETRVKELTDAISANTTTLATLKEFLERELTKP